jgi:hypothetical protein
MGKGGWREGRKREGGGKEREGERERLTYVVCIEAMAQM